MSAHVLTSKRAHGMDASISKGRGLASYFQCCRSEMFILDPVSGLFSIPDHGSLILRHGSKSREKCKCGVLPFVAFCCFSKF